MTTSDTLRIPFERLHDSPTQPRSAYNEAKMAELVASIKTMGVMQDIVVRPIIGRPDIDPSRDHFEIVFGHRRRRAAELAGEADMPCRVRSMSDIEVAMAQLTENISREDMSFLDTADAFARLVRDHGMTAEQLMAQFGLSKSAVYNLLKLRSLTEASRQAVATHGIGAEIATLIARVPAPLQPQAINRVLVKGYGEDKPTLLSFRDARRVLAGAYTTMLIPDDGFTPYDETLTTCGACINCPKYSNNDPALTSELGAGVCTDVPCHTAKVNAAEQRLIDEARSFGRVIEGESANDLTKGSSYVNPVGYMWANATAYRGQIGKDLVHISYEQACQRLLDANIGAPSRTFIEIGSEHTLRACYTRAEAQAITADLRTLLGLPAEHLAPTPSAAARAPEGGGENAESDEDTDADSEAEHTAQANRLVVDESPESLAVTRQWPIIRQAIMRKALAAERNTDDLRLVVATLADIMGDLPDDLVDVMGWREELEAQDVFKYGEDVDWLLKRLPDMSGDQLGLLVTLFALSHAPVVLLTGNAAQAKRALAERYGVDVLNPEGKGSQQTDNAGGAGGQLSDKAGAAGQAHDHERDPNTADMFGGATSTAKA
jgi:ParB/RepB/Spo0J family partition protein